MTTRTLPDDLVLFSGGHRPSEGRMCVMEAVAWVAGEPHSDTPSCTNPAVASFARTLNDRINDNALRTRLLAPLIPDLLEHPPSSPEIDRILAFKCADYAVRQVAPRALDSAKLPGEAAKLRALAPVADQTSAARAAAAAARAADAAPAAADAAYTADAAKEYEQAAAFLKDLCDIARMPVAA